MKSNNLFLYMKKECALFIIIEHLVICKSTLICCQVNFYIRFKFNVSLLVANVGWVCLCFCTLVLIRAT